MATPHEHLADADSRELMRAILNNTPGSGPYEKAKTILEQRALGEQIRFTQRLVWATWALVAVTVALVGTAVVQIAGICR